MSLLAPTPVGRPTAYRGRTASLAGPTRITGHVCLKTAGCTFKIYFVEAINCVDVYNIKLYFDVYAYSSKLLNFFDRSLTCLRADVFRRNFILIGFQ